MDKQAASEHIQSSGFHEFLGIQVEEFEPGYVKLLVPHREGFNRGDGRLIHGGILASVLDIAVTYAGISEVETSVPTVDLRIDYLRPAFQHELTVIGESVRVGGTVAVAQSEIRQEQDGEEKTVALGRGLLSTAHVNRD